MQSAPAARNRTRDAIFVVIALACLALCVSLARWQGRRGDAKEAMQRAWDAAQASAPARIEDTTSLAQLQDPARVVVVGRLLHRSSVWLDNRTLDGRAGFWLVTPLQPENGPAVLVARGWAPRDAVDRTRLPEVDEPREPVTIEGIATAELPHWLALGDPAVSGTLPAIWQNLDLESYQRASGMHVAARIVRQTGPDSGGLVRRWPRPDYGVDRHRGYEMQWYAIGAVFALGGLWFVFGPILRTRQGER